MNFLLRILIAAVVVLALYAVTPPFLHIIGFEMSGDVNTIFRVVVAIGAIGYVVFGPPVPRFWQA
jgi:hypothetical protein